MRSASALALIYRLETAFQQANVSASIGMSMRNAAGSLTDAFDNADKRMYEQKSQRKASRRKHDATPSQLTE